jgi:hypothetical protein
VVPAGAGRAADGPGHPDGAAQHQGTPVVTATGEPSELLLFAYGRQSAAKVELEGEKDAIAKLHETKQLGI